MIQTVGKWVLVVAALPFRIYQRRWRRRLPPTITAGGRTRTLTQHARQASHAGITAKRIERVLNDWLIRGQCVDSEGSRTITYWGFVPGLKSMIRVAVSLDDQRIVTAFPDRTAARHWNRGSREYFEGRCNNLEERDEGNV